MIFLSLENILVGFALLALDQSKLKHSRILYLLWNWLLLPNTYCSIWLNAKILPVCCMRNYAWWECRARAYFTNITCLKNPLLLELTTSFLLVAQSVRKILPSQPAQSQPGRLGGQAGRLGRDSSAVSGRDRTEGQNTGRLVAGLGWAGLGWAGLLISQQYYADTGSGGLITQIHLLL